MELRLIIGYSTLAILIVALGATAFVKWRRKRQELFRIWGRQKRRR
jgi:hypothetical protein